MKPRLLMRLAGCAVAMLALAFLAVPAFAQAPAAPTPNKGDTAFMFVSTVIVLLMTIPGLALFYGGLVRSKNMLSVLMQVFATVCLVAIIWVVYGYSLAFTSGGSLNAYIGGLDKAFLKGVSAETVAATFSNGVVIPEYLYVAFQMTFACITPTHRRRIRRAHEVLGAAAVHGAVGHLHLLPHGAHGLVLGRP